MTPLTYEIPEGAKETRCRSCQAKIYWIRTPAARRMPVNPNGEPHWANCPQSKDWKGKTREDPDSPQGELL